MSIIIPKAPKKTAKARQDYGTQANIRHEDHAKLKRLSAESGLSMTAILSRLIAEAIVEPRGRKPANGRR